MEWFIFRVAETYWGIEGSYVHRVVEEVPITPVPCMPFCHMGLIYYRGELFDVIDIGGLMEGNRSVYRPNSRIILLKWSLQKLALIPDEIIGFSWIEDNGKGRAVFSHKQQEVRHIGPNEIWEALLELDDGSG